MKVSFIKAVTVGAMLRCTAYVLSGGSTAVFAEAEVVDDADRLVLKASSTYLLRPREP